ncbi:hypothetical protein LR48_Vigan03g165100 [Vigna angularis]|uniref:Uncharacterized protein n=1 Tax=Phaseolus angularis TaxID=3914 RepID=A0A0L9U748_PHAAN|nr:hypothetical protein LR48_Vigan03g165100 [Vigna angularis]
MTPKLRASGAQAPQKGCPMGERWFTALKLQTGRPSFMLLALKKGHPGGLKMKLMKEVKRERDGDRKGHENCKRRESASTAQRQLPLSGTFQYPLAPLRGKLALRGRSEMRYYR